MVEPQTDTHAYDYDLLVIGSAAGWRSWTANRWVGVCISTGTIPSKTLREAVL